MLNPDAIPVTLLTGFLGAGKTTVLNAILADARFADSAVIVNEFGSVGVDGDLVRTGREGLMVTSTGCLCCTAGSDVRTSLFELSEAVEDGAAPPFRRVVVETTGLADPAPIINSLIPGGAPAFGLRDHVVARHYRLGTVATVLDAIDGPAALDTHLECWKQLAFADHVLLTKSDLAADADALMADWAERLRPLNPAARLHDRHASGFDLAAILGSGSYTLSDKLEDAVGWLALERLTAAEHPDHVHDANRHGSGIAALPLAMSEPLELSHVELFLQVLLQHTGPGVLRIKGLIALADDPDRPVVVHAVGRRLYPPVRLAAWPSPDRRTRLVVIGHDLPVGPIQEFFGALGPGKRKPRRTRAGT